MSPFERLQTQKGLLKLVAQVGISPEFDRHFLISF